MLAKQRNPLNQEQIEHLTVGILDVITLDIAHTQGLIEAWNALGEEGHKFASERWEELIRSVVGTPIFYLPGPDLAKPR